MISAKKLLYKAIQTLGYDYVTSESASSGWYWRKWKSGRVEAWGVTSASSKTGTEWAGASVSGLYYEDVTLTVPSGVFPSTPLRAYATSDTSQWWAMDAHPNSTTSISVRMVKPTSGAQDYKVYVYAVAF